MHRIRTLFILLATALVAGCGSDDARLTVLLKDAPTTDVSEAWVTITEINLVGSGGVTKLGPATPWTGDLLTLAAETATLVKDTVVTPGKYTELRFVVSDACISVNGTMYASPNSAIPQCANATGALRMPSMGQSGLKVTMSGNALDVSAGSKVLIVDFDVAQSFGVEAGGSGAWVMHPVITGGEITMSGNLVVNVATNVTVPGTSTCTVSLVAAGETPVTATLTVADINDHGAVAQLYPPAGTWTPALACSGLTITLASPVPGPVVINAGQASPSITFTIASAS